MCFYQSSPLKIWTWAEWWCKDSQTISWRNIVPLPPRQVPQPTSRDPVYCHLTLLVQKEWYPTLPILRFPNPDKDTAWNPRKKEKIKMISYSYPHPNRPPPLPPSYKESEEGLTIQVEFLWKWKFFSFIWRKIYEKGWPGWVFLEWKFFSLSDKIWERIFFSQCRIFWCCFWEGKY